MQKQLPVSFSLKIDDSINQDLVMVAMESSRSGKMVIRARGHWDGDLRTVIKCVPPIDPLENPTDERMSATHYYWDWLRYGSVLAILEITLEDLIDFPDTQAFIKMLPKPRYQEPGTYVQFDYFGKLEEFARSYEFKFLDNGFSSITMKWR